MERDELIDATHPDYLAAREVIVRHGVEPGSGGHDSNQLVQALWDRGWSWKLNEDDPRPDLPGDYARVWKAHSAVTGSHSISHRAATSVVVLTLVLADAIREDEHRAQEHKVPRQPDR